MLVFTQQKREVRSFFTLTEGFAIPLHSRKTTEVHARYIHPHTLRSSVEWILHTQWTFIVAATTVYEMLRRFRLAANNVNKRLLIMLCDATLHGMSQSVKHHGDKGTTFYLSANKITDNFDFQRNYI